MSGFNLDDYVDVAERVQLFYERYPDGRISTREVKFCQWPSDGIVAVAEAYRTAEDPHPGIGTAWEPVPGKTNYTRDSEVQNAETAAWGRAIAACGIGTKRGIASREEVRNRQSEPSNGRASTPRVQAKPVEGTERLATAAQKRLIFAKAAGIPEDELRAIFKAETGQTSEDRIPAAKVDPILAAIKTFIGSPA